MDKHGNNYNDEKIDVKSKPLTEVDSQNILLNGEGEKDDETASLLPPRIGGGLSRKLDQKPQRKVQWKDNNGKKLEEVLEYQPSDESDSDDEDSDSCICRIM